jgi:ureidoacrylate peracid hydrolase
MSASWTGGDSLAHKLEPASTALLIVDVQNDFCADDGHFARCGIDLRPSQEMVPRLAALVVRARQTGVLVVFVQAIYDEKYIGPAELDRRRRSGTEWPRCVEGTWGADFYGLQPAPGDLIVRKHRYSGFYATDLDLVLRSRGIRTVVVTGVATDVCVEATVRDAFMRDYYVVVVGDCTAATIASVQAAALDRLGTYFGVLTTSKEVGDLWTRESPRSRHEEKRGEVR